MSVIFWSERSELESALELMSSMIRWKKRSSHEQSSVWRNGMIWTRGWRQRRDSEREEAFTKRENREDAMTAAWLRTSDGTKWKSEATIRRWAAWRERM